MAALSLNLDPKDVRNFIEAEKNTPAALYIYRQPCSLQMIT